MACLPPDDEALSLGMRLLELEDYPGSVAALTRALERLGDARNSRTWQQVIYDPQPLTGSATAILFHRGVAFRRMRHYVEAIHDFNGVILAHPAHGPAFLQRGLCYLALGVSSRAERDLRTAMAMAGEACGELVLELPELTPFLPAAAA